MEGNMSPGEGQERSIREEKVKAAAARIRARGEVGEGALKEARETDDYYVEKLLAKILESREIGADYGRRLEELDRYGVRAYGEQTHRDAP